MMKLTQQVGQRALGKTGFMVSEVAFGTVELGMDYGIPIPGDYGRPSHQEAIRLLNDAADRGITLFDTASTYGESEALLGKALGDRSECVFGTKISIPRDQHGDLLEGVPLRDAVNRSLQNSMENLCREALDIVHIHNATVEVFSRGELPEALVEAKHTGVIKVLGASVYQEHEALAVIDSGVCDVLQVAYNILDQRMAQRVFRAAQTKGVGVLVRSPFLKGVLTAKAQCLPPEMTVLKQAAERTLTIVGETWDTLPQFALRYCLSAEAVSSVLVGIRTGPELDQCLASSVAGSLDQHTQELGKSAQMEEDYWLNPCHWPV